LTNKCFWNLENFKKLRHLSAMSDPQDNRKKLNDPTEAALSAIQEALNVRDDEERQTPAAGQNYGPQRAQRTLQSLTLFRWPLFRWATYSLGSPSSMSEEGAHEYYGYTRDQQFEEVVRQIVRREIEESEWQRPLNPLVSPKVSNLLTTTAALSAPAARRSESIKRLIEELNAPPDTNQKSAHSPLRSWIVEVWSYSGVLAAILTAIGWLFSGSLRLLGPVVFVCVAGGVIGTVLALLRFAQEQQDGGSASNYYERRIIR
jgi:hypothetical protein